MHSQATSTSADTPSLAGAVGGAGDEGGEEVDDLVPGDRDQTVRRGEVWWAEFDERRPVVLLSGEDPSGFRAMQVVAPADTDISGWGIEVAVGVQDGLPFDGVLRFAFPHPGFTPCTWLTTLSRDDLIEQAGAVSAAKLSEIDDALRTSERRTDSDSGRGGQGQRDQGLPPPTDSASGSRLRQARPIPTSKTTLRADGTSLSSMSPVPWRPAVLPCERSRREPRDRGGPGYSPASQPASGSVGSSGKRARPPAASVKCCPQPGHLSTSAWPAARSCLAASLSPSSGQTT
jgi:mRNA interferase MazF